MAEPLLKSTIEASLMVDPSEPHEASVVLLTKNIVKVNIMRRVSNENKSFLLPKKNFTQSCRLMEHAAVLWESCLVSFTTSK
jgi:hypothetical protein